MMFMSDTGASPLRSVFSEAAFGALSSATTAATAINLQYMERGSRVFFLENDLNTDLTVLAVHPMADATVTANRQLWYKVSPTRVINFDFGSFGNLVFIPGTKIFIFSAIVPSSGVVRLLTWG